MAFTLGIDLASQPAHTAGCLIRWDHGRAIVDRLELNLTDDAIIKMSGNAEKVGIDAPFGWPEPFVDFVQSHTAGTTDSTPWTNQWRDLLRFRRTDLVAKQTMGRWPLSVSTDLIGITAIRCAGLLSLLNVHDRSGDGRVAEVYPALALHQWGLLPRGYKGVKNTKVLATVFAELRCVCPWLNLSDENVTLLARNDHAFDALISSLVARAQMLNRTLPLPDEDRHLAATEGWIHIPEPNSLAHLVES